MIRLKRSIIVCSLFALLFVVVSAPVFLMEHQRKFSLNEVVPYSVEAVQLGRNEGVHSESPAVGVLSIWEAVPEPIPEPAPAQPAAQATIAPQSGDMVYVEGFGWIESQGPNRVEYAADMYENGNKIGIMG